MTFRIAPRGNSFGAVQRQTANTGDTIRPTNAPLMAMDTENSMGGSRGFTPTPPAGIDFAANGDWNAADWSTT